MVGPRPWLQQTFDAWHGLVVPEPPCGLGDIRRARHQLQWKVLIDDARCPQNRRLSETVRE